MLASLVLMATSVNAQTGLHKVDWRKARITDVGAYMLDMRLDIMQDAKSQQLDTVFVDNSRVIWKSQGYDVKDIENNDFYKGSEPIELPDVSTGDEDTDSLYNFVKSGIRKANGRPWPQEGCLQSTVFNKFYYSVYRFEYPSVDADDKPIMLSAMCACPSRSGASRVNNIILGTHVTITSDSQRPSAQTNNWGQDDWGMYFSLAAGNKLDYKGWFQALRYLATWYLETPIGTLISILNDYNNGSRNAAYNNNLVIMPDYEGYGLTKDRAHPYLYQELTARQCIDALLYGIDLYESSPDVEYCRHPIRSKFRTLVSGYSQGGSVAMACHRFIEQNGLAKELHFVGSYCGDGPYDPMATLMFYIEEDLANQKLKMPVVLPLIIKGMLDSNPYMKTHKASDYFKPEFLATGIMDWLTSKRYTTDHIADKFKAHGGIFDSKGETLLRNVMTEGCYNYFKTVYNANKNTFTSEAGIPLPTQRGVYEDLHFALASNNMTSNWKPEHTMYLFHSGYDHVVPYVNAESALSRLGSKVDLKTVYGMEHVDAGVAFFSQNDNLDVVLKDGLRLNDYVEKLCKKDYDK